MASTGGCSLLFARRICSECVSTKVLQALGSMTSCNTKFNGGGAFQPGARRNWPSSSCERYRFGGFSAQLVKLLF